jgi:hypothetical protein
VISGTPTAAGTFQVAITVSDSISQETAHVTLPLTVFSALNILNSSLPLAIVNRPYTCALAASGSATPFTWTVTGLPAGLTANSAGVISGTPTAAGTFTIDVSVTDSSDQTDHTSLTLTVAGVLTITTTSLPAASVGNLYGAGVSSTGGLSPYSWSATGLPVGLSIDQATGNITGTPTVAGPVQVTIHLSDASSQTAQVTLPMLVNPAAPPTLQIATSTLSTAAVGVVYAQFINASGGTGEYSFTTTAGSLPSGITFSTTGQLYGTPTSPGQFNFTVQVNDTQNFASRSFTLTVTPSAVTVSGAPPTSVTVGTAITTTFTATGGLQPYRFSTSGDLPPGTSFDSSTATLSGTVTGTGVFTFSVTATDSQTPPFTASQSFSVTVNPAALQISATLPPGQVGQPYSGAFSARGGAGGYTFSGSAGDGLSISASGAITGLPSTAQEVPVSVTVTDSSGAIATGTFSITIASASLLITTSTLPNAALNSTYSANLNASGGTAPYTFSATGLPGGLSISGAGAITGTPTALGTFTVTATVTDSTGAKSSANLSLTVAPAGLKITTTGVSQPTLGQTFSVGFGATGGTPPYTWSATGLPSGVTISATGTLSGTLSSMTPSSITVTVTDAAGTQSTETLTLSAALPAAPTLTFSGLPTNGSAGTQPSSTVTFSNTYPVPVTVNLTLTFAPANGPDDPNVVFSGGARTTSVTVPAGATVSLSSIGVQTGTVAGVITITANLVASGTDITPSPAPTRTITIAPAAPTISSVTLATTSTGLSVTVIGFDPTRSITQATFTFNPAAGSTLQTSTFTVTAQSQFNAWFQSSGSAQFGSQFNFTIPFTVTGNVSGIASVTVTLTNPTGTSSGVTGNL